MPKFTEEQLTKIRESLTASGIPEDVVEFTISDITADEKSGQPEEENKQGDPTAPAEEEIPADQTAPIDESEEAPVEEQEGEAAPVVEPIAEEVPPASEDPVPTPEEQAAPVVDPVAEQNPVGGYDDGPLKGLINDLQTELAEAKKTIDGQAARIDSLEEALKKGGFLDDSEAPVGDETPKAPAAVQVDDPMDDVLAQINGHKY